MTFGLALRQREPVPLEELIVQPLARKPFVKDFTKSRMVVNSLKINARQASVAVAI
jgi:hypothetical protein